MTEATECPFCDELIEDGQDGDGIVRHWTFEHDDAVLYRLQSFAAGSAAVLSERGVQPTAAVRMACVVDGDFELMDLAFPVESIPDMIRQLAAVLNEHE